MTEQQPDMEAEGESAPGPDSTASPSSARLPSLTAAQQERSGLLILGVVGLVLLLLFLFTRQDSAGSGLYPALPSPTPLPEIVISETSLLTFTELNAAPADYRDQRIQVSGAFTPVTPPTCRPYAGPDIRWSLVGEDLQLNAVGFEQVLSLLQPGTEMTVTGIWRAYQGPLGCGKEPEDGTAWYLQVDQILEPNPLFNPSQAVVTFVPGEQPTPVGLDTPQAPPLEETLPSPTFPVETPTVQFPDTTIPTPELEATPTLPTTPLGVTPLPTLPGETPTVNPFETGTPTPTPTVTGTPGAGTPTVPVPTSTLQGTGYPNPTATQEGYP